MLYGRCCLRPLVGQNYVDVHTLCDLNSARVRIGLQEDATYYERSCASASARVCVVCDVSLSLSNLFGCPVRHVPRAQDLTIFLRATTGLSELQQNQIKTLGW